MENIIFVGENVHGSHEFSENRFNIIRTYAQYDPIIILETDHIGFTYAYENGLSIDVCMRFLPNIYKTLEYYNLILYCRNNGLRMRGCDPVPRAIGFDMKLENSEQRKCQLINNEKITHAHDRYEMRDRLMAENISSNFDQQTNEVQICLLHNIHVKLSGSKERDENLRLPSCAEIVKMKIGNISSIGQYAKRGRYLDNHLNVKNFCISDPVSFENSCSVYNQTLPASPYCMPGYHWFKHKESIPICENYTEVILVEETTPSEIYSVQQ